MELDPTLAETQTTLATVQFNDDWNWKAAETGFRHAIQLNPSDATAHQRFSLYLIAMGRTDESLVEMNRARSLDPLSRSVNFSLGWRLYMARQYDQAISQLRNTIEMDPTYLLVHIVLGQCYEQEGKYSEAITELQKAASLSPDNPPALALWATPMRWLGNMLRPSRCSFNSSLFRHADTSLPFIWHICTSVSSTANKLSRGATEATTTAPTI